MKSIPLICAFLLIGCTGHTYEVEDPTIGEAMWFKPFTRTDTFIYVSDQGEQDSIVFHAPTTTTDSTRDPEQGYSNTTYWTVNYELTKGSFHQFALMSDGAQRYDHDFVNVYKSSAGYGSLEIDFIGTLFSDSIENVQELNDSTYFLDSRRADYDGMNVEQGVNSFTFHTRRGVIAFVDDRNVNWRLVKGNNN